MTIKVIIDTDIGGDIDDLLAIAMALESAEMDIVAITTVGVQSERRAKIARSLLATYGQPQIPVAAGASTPLAAQWAFHEAPNQYGPEMAPLEPCSSLDGADLMIQAVNDAPGEITIVAIGAMTNVAQALQRDPDFHRKVKEVILMGGEYSSHYREFNIVGDPEAADILFRSGIPLTAVGLEVCLGLVYDTDQAIGELLAAGTAQASFLARLVERWKYSGTTRPIIMFDAIPFALLIDRGVACVEARSVKVELLGKHTRGMTYSQMPHFGEGKHEIPNVQVCTAVDGKQIMALFKQRLLGEVSKAEPVSHARSE